MEKLLLPPLASYQEHIGLFLATNSLLTIILTIRFTKLIKV